MESSDEDEADSDNSENDDGIVELGAETYLPKKRSSKIHFDDDDPEAQINLDESEFADLDAQAAASVRQSKKEGHGFGEQKRTTAQGQETSRLAVVNLDWDFIKAAHLFSVFSSTAALAGDPEAQVKKRRAPAPKDGGGKIARVRIYPSEFGKSRLAKEDVEGPPKEIFANPQKEKKGAALLKSHGETFESDSDEDLDVEDINEKTIYHQGDVEEYDQDALRKYQLERLRRVSPVALTLPNELTLVDYQILLCDHRLRFTRYRCVLVQGARCHRTGKNCKSTGSELRAG